MLQKLILLLLVISCARLEDIERLSTNVVPSAYNLDLTLSETIFDDNLFTGTITITLDVKTEVTSFQLHAKKLTIEDIQLEDKDGVIINITYETGDESSEVLSIESETSLSPDSHYVLTITYNTRLGEKTMDGFYKSYYYIDEDRDRSYLASTAFEPMDARLAFPCFDEPEFKAVFRISITHPSSYTAFANTPVNYTTPVSESLTQTVFLPTPPMSTYLVAFTVSDFTCSTSDFNGIPLEVCGRPGTEDTTSLALEVTPKLLSFMENYTNYSFDSMNIQKLTQVEVPDMRFTMENWGLVDYREEDLLYDENESSAVYKQHVVKKVALEVAHQWFGDLVTASWWSDLFVNAGFATFFEYYAAAEVQPEWELQKQFVVEVLQTALFEDSLDSALPLSYDTDDKDILLQNFDKAYSKGGSIIRMVLQILGEENFKAGIANYLSKGPISTVESLWTSFDDFADNLPASISEIMESWTKKRGYPLVSISAEDSSVRITQEPFLLGDDEPRWFVPLSITNASSSSDLEETIFWLLPEANIILFDVIKDDGWVILNNQKTGFYRVDYDDVLLSRISALLEEDINNIEETSRSQLIDDQFSLAKAGKKTYAEVLQFLTFLKNDDSYYSWFSFFEGFERLLHCTSDEEVKTNLIDHIKNLMSPLLNSVSLDQINPDDQIYTLKQGLAFKWACYLGDEDCVSTSRQMFVDYTEDETKKPNPNLRSLVYCNGLRYSTDAINDFEFLWQKFYTSNLANEIVTILTTLGCVNDADVRRIYLNRTITPKIDDIKRQDNKYAYASVYLNNEPEGVTDVMDFIKTNYSSLTVHYPDNFATMTAMILTVSGLFTEEAQVDLLKEFIELEEIDTAVKDAALKGIEIAEQNIRECRNLEDDVRNFFNL